MMLSINSIFTIQPDLECALDLVSIETLITKGIYKFTLLGMPTKTASDTKDRVYAALRSSGLLNLKSDNRKIIVNLTPEHTLKKEGLYDLGIALSCISCLDADIPNTKALILGGLSISGTIMPTHRLKQAIYTAYIHNIPYIIGSVQEKIPSERDILMLKACGITLILAETLKDVTNAFKAQDFSHTLNENQPLLPSQDRDLGIIASISLSEFESMDQLTQALCIALCGGHHLLVEAPTQTTIKQTCSSICAYTQRPHFGRGAYMAFVDKTIDSEEYVSIQFIENLKNHSRAFIQDNQSLHKDSIIGTYQPCICGFQYSFFEQGGEAKKCICSQRAILQHKRHIQSAYFDIFSMHISVFQPYKHALSSDEIQKLHKFIQLVRDLQFERYSQEHGLSDTEIFMFSDNSYLNVHQNTDTLLESVHKKDMDLLISLENKRNALQVAQTVQDIFDVFSGLQAKKQSHISRKALLLAISFCSRMGS